MHEVEGKSAAVTLETRELLHHRDSLAGDEQNFQWVLYEFNVIEIHVSLHQLAFVHCLHNVCA